MSDGRLARFVPPVALEWLEAQPDVLHRGLEGTWLFTDVAGFTAVTERLSARGRVGAEELVETLSGVLDAMVAVGHGRGGQLVKFAGDALLFYFDGEEHALRATAAATELRTALRTATRVPTALGRLTLTASTGVHTGAADAILAGRHHRELALVGPVVSRLLELEGAAVASEVLVSAETAAHLPPDATTRRSDGAHTVVWRDAPDRVPRPAAAAPPADTHARRLLPALVADALQDRRFDPSHRVATMGFLRFGGTDSRLLEEGRGGVAERVSVVLDLVQDAFAAEDITLLSVDAEANGVKVYASAGVPLTSEDDEGRLLRACRAVVAADPPLPVQVGINRGHVFAAELGTGVRAAFSAMGDTVNTAARICSKAPAGAVWAHPAVREHARQRWAATPRGPFAFKGKSEPQPVDEIGQHLGARSSTRTADTPLVGRRTEVEHLARDLAQALGGGTGGIAVQGAVGVGKSRIVDEALAGCDADVLALHAEPYGTATPYRVVRDAVRTILGVHRGDDDQMTDELLAGVRRLVPQHEPLAALLGDVAAVDVPPSEEVLTLLPRYRPDRTLEVLVDLLDVVHDRLVVCVEDAHWADAASARLLAGLRRAAVDRPWCILVVRRDEEGGLQASSGAEVHQVEPLSDDDVRDLVLSLSADEPMLPHAVDDVVRRAAGNPLFATELVLTASQGGGTPDSLQGAITARVDVLPPVARRVLSYASVLGVTFRRDVLDEVLATERLELDATTLEELRRFLVGGPDERISFRVGVVRDVVYDGLGYRLRSRLHGEAAAAVERFGADDAADAALLALHWSQADEHDRALPYALAAADRAERAHANEEAAANLELALVALRSARTAGAGSAQRREQARELWLRLGDVRDLAGGPRQALDAYRRAARLSDGPRLRAVVGLRRIGVREQQGAFATALREVAVIRRELQGDDSVEARRLRASAAALGAVVRQRQERPTDALDRARLAVAEAGAAGEQRALARAESVLAWAAMVLDLPERDQHLRRALQLFEDAGDLTGVAHIANNLGVLAYYDGNWTEALSWYGRAEEALRRTGNLAAAALTAANAGELLVNQERLEEADEVLQAAARVLRVVGHNWGAPFAELHRGRLELARGRAREAAELLEHCIAEFEALGNPMWAYEASLHLAPALVRQGDPLAAVTLLEGLGSDGLDGAELLDAARAWSEATALAAVGRHEAATERISEGLRTARRRGLAYDHARLLLLADELGIRDPELVGTGTPAEDARAILDQLGVDQSQRGSPAPS